MPSNLRVQLKANEDLIDSLTDHLVELSHDIEACNDELLLKTKTDAIRSDALRISAIYRRLMKVRERRSKAKDFMFDV